MSKMVGMAEFKANCTRLLRELQADGEPITVTSRGKPVATVTPAPEVERRDPETRGRNPLFGALKGTVTTYGDIVGPIDPDWEAKWDAKWDEKLGATARDVARR